MPHLGGPELLIILVIVMMVFGAGKLAGIGKSLGQGIREFRQASVEEPPSEMLTAPTCPQCHTAINPRDRFCSACGAPVSDESIHPVAPASRPG
jgi:sec-independent protein translocase protein TatA